MDWEEALSGITAEPATHAYFPRLSSSAFSNRNREAKVNYPGNLGYDIFNTISKMNDEERAYDK